MSFFIDVQIVGWHNIRTGSAKWKPEVRYNFSKYSDNRRQSDFSLE